MAGRSTLGTSALALKLAASESVWAVGDSVIGADSNITVAQKMPLPSRTRSSLSDNTSLNLYKNTGIEPALLLLGGPMNSCVMTIEAEDGDVVVRSSSFVATNNGGIIRAHEPIFNDHPDYEPMDWSEFQDRVFLVISGRGALFQIPIDGEHLVDVDTIVAYNCGLTITPVTSDGSTTAKQIADIHQPVYRFTGRGSLWCQAGRTREFGRLLRPHLNKRPP